MREQHTTRPFQKREQKKREEVVCPPPPSSSQIIHLAQLHSSLPDKTVTVRKDKSLAGGDCVLFFVLLFVCLFCFCPENEIKRKKKRPKEEKHRNKDCATRLTTSWKKAETGKLRKKWKKKRERDALVALHWPRCSAAAFSSIPLFPWETRKTEPDHDHVVKSTVTYFSKLFLPQILLRRHAFFH